MPCTVLYIFYLSPRRFIPLLLISALNGGVHIFIVVLKYTLIGIPWVTYLVVVLAHAWLQCPGDPKQQSSGLTLACMGWR